MSSPDLGPNRAGPRYLTEEEAIKFILKNAENGGA